MCGTRSYRGCAKKLALLAAVSFVGFFGSKAHAIPVYTGGNGGISFGVAPYGGAPNVGGPTYIANNFTGLNDILSSPGLGSLGGYLTASPIVANNIASYGPGALPGAAFQIGGGNGNGAFGFANGVIDGPTMGYAISDSAPGGGSASYIIESETTSFTDAAGTAAGNYGGWLGMAGNVNLVGSADVAALKVRLSSANAASPFFGGVNLPQMVLAISRNGAGTGIGNYNIVTIGGAAGGNAGLILDNGNTGSFRALAVDSIPLAAAIPAGDVITVNATLTAYADPADISTFDIAPADLLGLTGPLPSLDLIAPSTVTPEPASLGLIALGTIGLLGRRHRQRD